MNSKNIIILSMFVTLCIGLFLSTKYDQVINSDKIAMYQCENNIVIPFPKGYILANKKLNSEELKQSYQLYWDSIGLTGLPNDFFKDYPCIKSLHCSNNHFKEIPVAISALKNLQELFLNKNQIVSFNETIDYDQLRHLYFIKLSHNLIDTLGFIPLTRNYLRLELDHNKIEHVNSLYQHLPIQLLNLSYNQLEKFPENLYSMQNLLKLNLSNNKISGEVVLRDLIGLQDLDISNQTNSDSSKIEKLVFEDFGSILIKLNASGNHIKELSSISKTLQENNLAQLKQVDLSYNNFTSFPHLLYQVQTLKELNLSHNQLSSLRFEYQLYELTRINLSHNKLVDVQQLDRISATDINLSHNKLKAFPLFIDNYPLHKLDLSHNKISSMYNLLYNEKSKLYRIDSLNLSHNNIKSFENSNKEFNLFFDVLDLSHNKIKVFHLDSNQGIKTLNLSHNLLEEFIYSKNNLSLLVSLNLSNNPNLKSIPTELILSSDGLLHINIKNTDFDKKFLKFLTDYCATKHIQLIK